MTKNVPKLTSDLTTIQETQRTPSRMNVKNTMLRHIIFKLQKIKEKEKVLKETKGKEKPYL